MVLRAARAGRAYSAALEWGSRDTCGGLVDGRSMLLKATLAAQGRAAIHAAGVRRAV